MISGTHKLSSISVHFSVKIFLGLSVVSLTHCHCCVSTIIHVSQSSDSRRARFWFARFRFRIRINSKHIYWNKKSNQTKIWSKPFATGHMKPVKDVSKQSTWSRILFYTLLSEIVRNINTTSMRVKHVANSLKFFTRVKFVIYLVLKGIKS